MEKENWHYVTHGVEGVVKLFGVDICNCHWTSTGEKVEVKDPLYGKPHLFNVYTANIDGVEHTFAAGEFSNSIFGFYMKD